MSNVASPLTAGIAGKTAARSARSSSKPSAKPSSSPSDLGGTRIASRRIIAAIQLGCYVTGALVMQLFAIAGSIPMWVPATHFVVSMMLLGSFYVLSGIVSHNAVRERLVDVCEFALNIAVQLGFAWIVPQIAFSFLTVLFVMFSVASLSIGLRHTLVTLAFACCGLVLVACNAGRPLGLTMSSTLEQIAAFASIATLLFQTTMVGCYGGLMRSQLKRQRIKLNEANQKISEIANVDGLTGIYNRRFVMAHLDAQIEQFETARTTCAVAMFDIDWFKKINDNFGHPVGDDVLQTFAVTISANLRDADLFGRYGGEEFILLLPDTSASDAERCVERLRFIIAELNWSAIAQDMQVTMSAGVTALEDGDSAEAALSRVDAALYRSKQAGRNRVTLA